MEMPTRTGEIEMSWAFEDHMTQEQLDCLLSTEDMKNEWRMCHHNYVKAKAVSWVGLPQTAVSGKPVVVGANNVIGSIADYWKDRRNLIARFMPNRDVYQLEDEVKDEQNNYVS
jgi:hypothetical protein